MKWQGVGAGGREGEGGAGRRGPRPHPPSFSHTHTPTHPLHTHTCPPHTLTQREDKDRKKAFTSRKAKPLWEEDGKRRGLLDKYDEEEAEMMQV